MTSATSPGTAFDRSIDPLDFGDPTAISVGECPAPNSITNAAHYARTALATLHEGFGVEKIQFTFNGTPAVVSVGDTAQQVCIDWNTRREAYQRAAGILD